MGKLKVVVRASYSLRCQGEDGHLVGSITAIGKDIIVEIEYVTKLYYIVQFRGEGGYIQINCKTYEIVDI